MTDVRFLIHCVGRDRMRDLVEIDGIPCKSIPNTVSSATLALDRNRLEMDCIGRDGVMSMIGDRYATSSGLCFWRGYSKPRLGASGRTGQCWWKGGEGLVAQPQADRIIVSQC